MAPPFVFFTPLAKSRRHAATEANFICEQSVASIIEQYW